ncbi:MAG: hypothetical protein J7J06_02935 [Methanosarcinales archaeon]|nr:hypothetical protein [Methanosarcinales archaeon]
MDKIGGLLLDMKTNDDDQNRWHIASWYDKKMSGFETTSAIAGLLAVTCFERN